MAFATSGGSKRQPQDAAPIGEGAHAVLASVGGGGASTVAAASADGSADAMSSVGGSSVDAPSFPGSAIFSSPPARNTHMTLSDNPLYSHGGAFPLSAGGAGVECEPESRAASVECELESRTLALLAVLHARPDEAAPYAEALIRQINVALAADEGIAENVDLAEHVGVAENVDLAENVGVAANVGVVEGPGFAEAVPAPHDLWRGIPVSVGGASGVMQDACSSGSGVGMCCRCCS